jgi:hypothetical protein
MASEFLHFAGLREENSMPAAMQWRWAHGAAERPHVE